MGKKKKKSRKSGGSIMNMRSGVKGLVGQKKKGKQDVSFATIMGWMIVVSILGIVIWGMGGI